MSGSILNAPASTEVFCVWAGYGAVQGFRSFSRGRLWLLAESADPDAALFARVAWNDQTTGQVVYDDVGPVATARIRGGKWADLSMVNGRKLTQTVAPCVCGAGAVGYAGPMEGRHYVTALNARSHNRIEMS